MWGIFAILSGSFWYPPGLEPRALTPTEVFSATATFWKKRDGGKLPGEENQWEGGDDAMEQWQCGCLGTAWHKGLGPHAGVRGAENNLSLGDDRALSSVPSPWLCSRHVWDAGNEVVTYVGEIFPLCVSPCGSLTGNKICKPH